MYNTTGCLLNISHNAQMAYCMFMESISYAPVIVSKRGYNNKDSLMPFENLFLLTKYPL